MEDGIKTDYGGKRSVGGQKRRWNYFVLSDLKKCDLLPDWRDMAHERGASCDLVKEASAELNRSLEEEEVKKKDERKLRREVNSEPAQPPSAHLCTEPGCNFVGQTKAGLVNHTRQRHGVSARAQYPCSHCGGSVLQTRSSHASTILLRESQQAATDKATNWLICGLHHLTFE